jgi:hypothetical protein
VTISSSVVGKLKEIRKLRSKYYHLQQKRILYEETRVLFRVMTRDSEVTIGKYISARWQSSFPRYIDCLIKCFNIWLSEWRYPDGWKLTKIITLTKIQSDIPKCLLSIQVLTSYQEVKNNIVANLMRLDVYVDHSAHICSLYSLVI